MLYFASDKVKLLAPFFSQKSNLEESSVSLSTPLIKDWDEIF